MQQYLPPLGAPFQRIFNTRFRRKSDSKLVMAEMFSPRSSTTGGLEFNMRLTRVAPNSILVAGDVLIGARGKKYLLIDAGAEERKTQDFRMFKTIELDRQTDVQRMVPGARDPVTKRSVDVLTNIGTMDYTEVPLRPEEDTFRIQGDRYELLTDFPLQVGDKILGGSRVVKQVEVRFGAYWARVSDG